MPIYLSLYLRHDKHMYLRVSPYLVMYILRCKSCHARVKKCTYTYAQIYTYIDANTHTFSGTDIYISIYIFIAKASYTHIHIAFALALPSS